MRVAHAGVEVRVLVELGPLEYFDTPVEWGRSPKYARILWINLYLDPLAGESRYSGSGKYLTKDGHLGQVNYRATHLRPDRVPQAVRDFLEDRAWDALAGTGSGRRATP